MKTIFTCDKCGNGICEGDEYVDIDGEHYHIDCLTEMSIREVVKLFGYRVEEAEEMIPDYEERYRRRASGY
jgi:hypothetical protein